MSFTAQKINLIFSVSEEIIFFSCEFDYNCPMQFGIEKITEKNKMRIIIHKIIDNM